MERELQAMQKRLRDLAAIRRPSEAQMERMAVIAVEIDEIREALGC